MSGSTGHLDRPAFETDTIAERIMSKPTPPDHSDTPHLHLHSPLQALIETLHRMMISVSERLRHVHIHHRKQMEHAKSSYDIWAKIGSRIEQIHTESQERPAMDPQVSEPARPGQSSARPYDTHVAPGRFSALSKYYTRKTIAEHHPHMDEVLRNRTMEHISSALQMARKGNRDGAKLHVNVAENAMHTASRFMNHDDYEAFERHVEQRLESLLEDTPYQPCNH